jgi:hypothetical protein
MRSPSGAHTTVSARWLATAAGIAILAAGACAWGTLCLLFWQGSWQLLYHPKSAVTRTPASAGLNFQPTAFAATEAGEPRLRGWWIPAAANARHGRYTVLYLHGQNGNLSETVDALVALHAVGVNVLDFDYRGYGQSHFEHPSEARWREDAEWALKYLTGTRHVDAGTIVLDGAALGANLALEVAAAHPELAGVVLDEPLQAPMGAIFRDPRAQLVPAHLLVGDRFETNQAAQDLRTPSLWLVSAQDKNQSVSFTEYPTGYSRVAASKTIVWLTLVADPMQQTVKSLSRWLDDLSTIAKPEQLYPETSAPKSTRPQGGVPSDRSSSLGW